MGNKELDRVPEIPYTGALKKLFEQIHNANIHGDVNVGKKYWPKRVLAAPRQWYLEIQKLPKDSGYGLKVVMNGTIPPGTGVAFCTLTSILVTDVKVCTPYIILWVENASGSVANLFFADGEEQFQARLFTESVMLYEDAVREIREERGPILTPKNIQDLNGDVVKVSRVVNRVLGSVRAVNTVFIAKANAAAIPRARKRPAPPTSTCPPASSRDKQCKGKEKAAVTEVVEVDNSSARDQDVAVFIEQEVTAEPIASRQFPIGSNSSNEDELARVSPKSTKRRKKQTSVNKRKRLRVSPEESVTVGTMHILETQFQKECRMECTTILKPPKRNAVQRQHRHPKKVTVGQGINIADCQEELTDFKSRSSPMYLWGQYFTKDISVYNMVEAPKDMKYRPFHESLVDTLLQLFVTALHPMKQTLTLMPKYTEKPDKYDDVKDHTFYIINGQHSWAAAQRLLQSPDVEDTVKDDYRYWTCDFVWTMDKLQLSELSRRTNNANQFHWDSPEYLLHIEYARELWIEYNKPNPATDKAKWKEFQTKAVETLNAMTFKNANKTANEYQGEFRVLCAGDDLYQSILNACKWYESGDLINPDSGNKWRDDSKDTWVRKFTVAYTFKCLRGLGAESLAELVEKIMEGLTMSGEIESKIGIPPKVYFGQTRPKNKFCMSLKEWTDRKKAKNAVVRWLNRMCSEEIWTGDDVDVEEWRKFKRGKGFNSAHMDELIRRATKPFLAKFMKVSDNPKREQDAPPDEFLAEMNRVLEKDIVRRCDLTPVLSVYQKSGTLTKFARSRSGSTPTKSPGIDEDCQTWQALPTAEMYFVGGVIDFRPLDTFLLQEDVAFDEQLGRTYLAVLKRFAEPNLLMALPYWLVIAHSNKHAEVLYAMRHHLPDYSVMESRYVPAASESYFFSNTTLKKGNGVSILLFTKTKAKTLKWRDQVRSQERYKKVGHVKEYGIHDDELRMEVYMDYLCQVAGLEHLDNQGVRDVLCITTGRKCMTAAVMYGMRPVAMVLADECLELFLLSHKIGCQLVGFEHLFHTAILTDDVVEKKKFCWLDLEQDLRSDSAEGSEVEFTEMRTKMMSDKSTMVEEGEEAMSDNTLGGSIADAEDEIQGVGINEDISVVAPQSPECERLSSTPSSQELICSNKEYNDRSMCTEREKCSPAAEIYKRSYFAETCDFVDALISDPAEFLQQSLVDGVVDESSLLPTLKGGDVHRRPFTVARVDAQHSAVRNCPVENAVEDMTELDQSLQEHHTCTAREVEPLVTGPEGGGLLQNVALVHLSRAQQNVTETSDILPILNLKQEAAAIEMTIASNKENPIVIESDEDDILFKKAVTDYPSGGESDLSEGPTDITGSASEEKVSQNRALRIQLRSISKKKLAINRANRLKSRELEMQNAMLKRELAKERKLREEAHERIRIAGLREASIGEYMNSPSTPLTQQATTSIASAPEMSGSEAGGSGPRGGGTDYILATQESVIRELHATLADPKLLQGSREIMAAGYHPVQHVDHSSDDRTVHKRRKLHRYISDTESAT